MKNNIQLLFLYIYKAKGNNLIFFNCTYRIKEKR